MRAPRVLRRRPPGVAGTPGRGQPGRRATGRAGLANPERLPVAGDDDARRGPHPVAPAVPRSLAPGQWIDRWRPVAPPPEVRQGVNRVIRLDDERGVLLGVAGCQPKLRA